MHMLARISVVLLVVAFALFGDGEALLISKAYREKRQQQLERGNPICTLREQQPTAPMGFQGFDHGSRYEGLYVNQPAKFAFCLIEKNACTHWGMIMEKLEKNNTNVHRIDHRIARATFSPDKAAAVFNDPEATRAVFVRDPLERLLSAFLDKCMGSNCDNGYCRARRQKGEKIPFSEAVEWIKQAPRLHGHWGFQSEHCELYRRVHEYNVIGVMDKATLADNAACLLDRAGLSRFNVRGQGSKEPFWTHDDSSPSKTESTLKSFYTKEAAEAMYAFFEQDYKTFGLPRPAWIDVSRGQFYNETQRLDCSPAKLPLRPRDTGLEAVALGNDDEDDIVVLARRAGFDV